MSVEAKTKLIAGMDERRQKHIEAMRGIPLDAIVHPESGWRVQDLLGHLAHFEQITIDTIQALIRGESYMPDFSGGINAFNDREYQRNKDKSAQVMFDHWQATREALKATLMGLDETQWQLSTKTAHSREAMTPEEMAKGMGWHEGIHMKEILALKGDEA